MKYCSKCSSETERYGSGHCKPCVKKRNELKNIERSSLKMSIVNRRAIKEDKEIFNKDLYNKFSIDEIINLNKLGQDKFIYFLLKKDELVYIGKSNRNFLGRINSHLKDKDFDSIMYKTILTESSLGKVEKQLITKYRPKLNKEFIFNDAKYDIFDLKTEEVVRDTKSNLRIRLNSSKSGIDNLLSEGRLKLYGRYVLLKNKPKESSFRKVLDNETGLIEKHNYITFAEKTGERQNNVWSFMNGITKSFMKKRYVLVD